MSLKDRIEKYARNKPEKIRAQMLRITENLEDHEIQHLHAVLGIALEMSDAFKSADLDCPERILQT